MAITSVEIAHPENGGAWRGTRGLEGARTYSRVYQVVSNSVDDGPLTVRTATAGANSIPAMYDAYAEGGESDENAFVISKDADLAEVVRGTAGTEFLWYVTVNWGPLPDGQQCPNPLDCPPEISFRFEHFEDIAEQDINGNGVLNSASQYFDPPIQKDNSRPVLTIKRNEEDFDASLAIAFQDAVNIDEFFGAEPNQVKVFNISANFKTAVVEENGEETIVEYWEVTYEFHFKWDYWTKQILDQGRYELGSGENGSTLVSIKDTDGNAVNDPVLLDGNGQARPQGPAVFLPYNVYRILPFSALNLEE